MTDPSGPASPPPSSRGLQPVLAYTLARLGLFVVVAGLLYLVGLRRFALVIAALVITLPLSYVLLRRQRQALSDQIERRAQRRVELRSQLRGDDELRSQLRGDDELRSQLRGDDEPGPPDEAGASEQR